MLGSIGMQEILIILIIALLLFGAKRLPEIGRTLGKGISEFRKAQKGLTDAIEREVEKAEKEGEEKRADKGDGGKIDVKGDEKSDEGRKKLSI